MNIILYKFNKKINSCKRPDNTVQSYTITGAYINNAQSSICQFNLRVPSNKANITYEEYNYCYISKFSRYYWIHDWHFNGDGTFTARCIVDPLASFQGIIYTGEGMVARTGNPQLVDNTLIDIKFPATNDYYATETEGTLTSRTGTPLHKDLFSPSIDKGCFILAIVSNIAPVFGAVNYYVMPPAQLALLVHNMINTMDADQFTPQTWGTEGLTSDMLKSIVSPMQYIKKCTWCCVNIDTIMQDGLISTMEDIRLGYWPTGAQGYKLNALGTYNASNSSTDVIDIPTPAYIAARAVTPDRWVDPPNRNNVIVYPPYATYHLYNPLIGDVELDGFIMGKIINQGTSDIRMNVQYNLIKGEAIFSVNAWPLATGSIDNDVEIDINRYTLFNAVAPISVEIPLADISTNYVNLAKSAMPATMRAIATRGASLLLDTGAIIDAVNYVLSPNVNSAGASNGAYFAGINTVKLRAIYKKTIRQEITHYGKPRYRYETLTQHTGYFVQVDDFHFTNIAGAFPLKYEIDTIVQNMKDGVYLE